MVLFFTIVIFAVLCLFFAPLSNGDIAIDIDGVQLNLLDVMYPCERLHFSMHSGEEDGEDNDNHRQVRTLFQSQHSISSGGNTHTYYAANHNTAQQHSSALYPTYPGPGSTSSNSNTNPQTTSSSHVAPSNLRTIPKIPPHIYHGKTSSSNSISSNNQPTPLSPMQQQEQQGLSYSTTTYTKTSTTTTTSIVSGYSTSPSLPLPVTQPVPSPVAEPLPQPTPVASPVHKPSPKVIHYAHRPLPQTSVTHSTHHTPQSTPASNPNSDNKVSNPSNHARAKALESISPIGGTRHEVDFSKWLQVVERHESFAEYITANIGNHDANDQEPTALSESSTQSNIWKPSAHSPPFAYFDTQTNHTRLTWCERDSHEMQNEQYLLKHGLANKRIMFLGDSVTRYQYLDLVCMITHETWCDDLLLVDEHLHANWEAFYDYADKKFKHQELCDCYHRPPTTKGVFDTWLQCENRRFHSEKWNTTVWFFLWYGAKAMPHGHFNISEDIQPLSCMPAMCHENAESSNKWELSPSEFVFEFVKKHTILIYY